VVRTRVGYAGGSKVNPTYYSLGDHSETIQIDYDPTQIGYEQLLDLFWSGHRCDHPAYSIQYASRIFYHNEAQRRLAEESKAREEARLGKQLYTSIEPAGTFYQAEDYHQKYRLQGSRQLMAELRQIYPDLDDFVNSTLAARLNGYLGGAGTREQLEAEIDEYGLSEGAQELLKRIVR
jgi:peptide-methionine (S)-S-oxide reductase